MPNEPSGAERNWSQCRVLDIALAYSFFLRKKETGLAVHPCGVTWCALVVAVVHARRAARDVSDNAGSASLIAGEEHANQGPADDQGPTAAGLSALESRYPLSLTFLPPTTRSSSE